MSTATMTRVDPRVAARRRGVARERARRRGRRLVLVLAVVLLVGGVVAALRSPVLDVDRVRISGTDATRTAEVSIAVGIEAGDAMVNLDLDQARAVVAALPWVADVQIDRRWPSTVAVRVLERRPVAGVAAGAAGWAVVDAEGMVIETRPTEPSDVLVIRGVETGARPGEATGADLRSALAVAAVLPARMRPLVAAVTVSPGGAELQLRTEPAATVRLGPAEDLEIAFASLAALVEARRLGCVTVIDLVVPDQPLLTRAENCQ